MLMLMLLTTTPLIKGLYTQINYCKHLNEKARFSFGMRRILGINATRQVTIPKDWLRNRELDKGDRVEVLLTDECNLLIVPAAKEVKDGGE